MSRQTHNFYFNLQKTPTHPNAIAPSLIHMKFVPFCRDVRRLINCQAYKFCLKTIPESIQEHIVTPFQFFKRLTCQPFFSWSRELGKIEIYLDNSHEPYNIKKTD